MTTTIEQMRAQVRGEVIEPSDDGYDEARKVYNAMHDRRPRVVVRCADAGDVAAAVRTGREQGLELAVRGGGHSGAGVGAAGDGGGIGLSPMRNVHVDPAVALARGGGNFGIATSLEFELHPVDDIVGGPIFFELDAAADVLRAYREYIADAPEELGAFFAFQIAPPLPFIAEERQGDTLCALVTCWS